MRNLLFDNAVPIPDMESPRQIMQANQARVLRPVNFFLAMVCLLVLTSFACSVVFQKPGNQLMAEAPVISAMSPERTPWLLPAAKVEGISRIRNLFEPLTHVASGDAGSQYKVVGIILDRHPQAVLKDLSSGRSVFLHQGDRIGGAIVTSIVEGKIILSSGQNTWEMKP